MCVCVCSEYNSLVGGKRVHWKLRDNKLVCLEKNVEVGVVAEELAYNKKYNQYRLFVVSTPLTSSNGQQQVLLQRQKKTRKGAIEDLLVPPRRTALEHLQLLQHFSKHAEVSSANHCLNRVPYLLLLLL